MNTACDTETCKTCGTSTIEGVDQNSQCSRCVSGAGERSLLILLRASAAGVRRDKTNGRFTSTKGSK